MLCFLEKDIYYLMLILDIQYIFRGYIAYFA